MVLELESKLPLEISVEYNFSFSFKFSVYCLMKHFDFICQFFNLQIFIAVCFKLILYCCYYFQEIKQMTKTEFVGKNVRFISLRQLYFQMLKCLNFINASNTAKTRNVAHPRTKVVPNPIVIQIKFHTTQYSSKSYQWLVWKDFLNFFHF